MIYSFEYMMGAHCFETDWHRKADKDFPEFGVLTVFSSAPDTFSKEDSVELYGRHFRYMDTDPPEEPGAEYSHYFSYEEKLNAGDS